MRCDSPFLVTKKDSGERVPVPCGRCPPCKVRRVNDWVFRLLQEDKNHTRSLFVTLTYDTETVPISPNGFMTLKKSDLQNFFKRLRKRIGIKGLKYYACGEYGSTNKRPHYHAIIFGVEHIDDIAHAWTLDGKPIGMVHIGNVSGDSIAYTMKYIDKKPVIPQHSRDDRLKEFPLMSKGLGKSYVEDQSILRYHKADLMRLFVTLPGGYRKSLPRYYRQKIYTQEEQDQQADMIDALIKDNEQLEELRHIQNGYTQKSYTELKDQARFNRYNNFYHKLKNRDL